MTIKLLRSILIILIYIFYFNIGKCSGDCYFPPELQGSYLTQSTITENQIQYSEVNITAYSIPIWGICHRRVGNNVILSSDETECYRCFNLKLVSRNILRVITTEPDFIAKCYTNEDKALASCPTDEILLNPLNYTKIIHYKYLDIEGNDIRYEYCPINGRYKFNYNNDDGKEDVIECVSNNSELDNCPSGSAMNLRFKECFFENHELRFECLGHWTDLDGKNYLALVNNGPSYNYHHYNYHNNNGNMKGIFKPQYRCGIFEEDLQTGSVVIQFSKDSTCTIFNGTETILKSKNNNNNNYNNGGSNSNGAISINSNILSSNSETLILYPSNRNLYWPHENFCIFPSWLQGEWQHITVKNDTFIFRDQISFKSYTMKCIEQNLDDTILVYSRTQCDEESYKCLKIKYRSLNVIEFQIGSRSSNNYNTSLCSDDNFDDTKWLTQGHLNETYTACPVSGTLEGLLPDALNYCAKLSSDCKLQDFMHYEVSICNSDILEEREYRCLGQWTEGDYVFTYTRRLDIRTYECFIGGMEDDQTIFIKEAGEHCQRNIDPFKYGMKLKQTEPCTSSSSSREYHQPSILTPTATESMEIYKLPKFLSTFSASQFQPSSTLSPSQINSLSSTIHDSNSNSNDYNGSILNNEVTNKFISTTLTPKEMTKSATNLTSVQSKSHNKNEKSSKDNENSTKNSTSSLLSPLIFHLNFILLIFVINYH